MKKTIRILCIALASLLVLGAAVLAAGESASVGSEGDPLVTLSYVTEVFTDYVTELFRDQLDRKAEALSDTLESRLSALEKAAEASGGVPAESGLTFEVVTLRDGETLVCERGTELLLRIGTAYAAAADSPALVDTGTADTLENGDSLRKNHMYMVTISDHGIRASGTVKVVVRGTYRVKTA